MSRRSIISEVHKPAQIIAQKNKVREMNASEFASHTNNTAESSDKKYASTCPIFGSFYEKGSK